MLLAVDRAAIAIQFAVQFGLLPPCDMTAMRRLVAFELAFDARIAARIASGLTRRQLAAVDALIDTPFLIVDPALNLVNARMVRNVLRENWSSTESPLSKRQRKGMMPSQVFS